MKRSATVESFGATQLRPSAIALELAQKTERVKELQSQLDRLRGVAEEKRILEDEIAALRQEYAHYKTTVGALKGENHVMQYQKCAALTRDLESERAEKARICAEAEEKIRQQNKEIYDQSSQILRLNEERERLYAGLVKSRAVVAQHVSAHQETKKRCTRSLAQMRRRVIELRQELQSVRRQSQELKQLPVQRVVRACRQAVAAMEQRLRAERDKRDRAETALRVVLTSRRRRAPTYEVERGFWMSVH